MKNFERALVLAQKYRALVARGDVVLADEAARTIDELVGRWQTYQRFIWPTPIAEAAGVDPTRRPVESGAPVRPW